jgi:cation:H+ antiporter
VDALTLGLLGLGLVLLIVGAELLVRGASSLAVAAGITPVVIGLTVVAFGTSAPELAVSLQASLGGRPDIALGNVIGSNIANILLILGIAGLIAPLVVTRQIVRVDVPIMIAASFLLLWMAGNGVISTIEGGVLVACLVGYLLLQLRLGRNGGGVEAEGEGEEIGSVRGGWPLGVLLVLVGLALLVLGSRWLVEGAVAVATTLGVSQLVIGLTVVAIGTSLPEIATTVMAALRGQRDMAVGNVIGSNLFNILSILGISALVAPGGIPVARAAISFDLPVMVAVAVATLPIVLTGQRIGRWEGALFLGYYASYIGYVVLAATQHDALDEYGGVMLFFVLPLSVLTLVALGLGALRRRRREP